VSDIFQIHTLFQIVFFNVGFLDVGQIFHDIPTWLKRHIATKCQAHKVDYALFLSTYFLAYLPKKSINASQNRKKPSWYINC